MQTNPVVEQIKTLHGQRVRGIRPVGEEVYGPGGWGREIFKKPSLKPRMKD